MRRGRFRNVPPLAWVVIGAVLIAAWQALPFNPQASRVFVGPNGSLTFVEPDGTVRSTSTPSCTPTERPTPPPSQASVEVESAEPFAMRVKAGFGEGLVCLPNGQWGQSQQYSFTGEPQRGAPPAPGSRVLIGRTDGAPLSVAVSRSTQDARGGVTLTVDGVSLRDAAHAYVLSTAASALSEVSPLPPRPGQPTAEDEYADYHGAGVRHSVGGNDDVDYEIQLQLARTPSDDEAHAVERAIRAWDEHGVVDGFGSALLIGGPGYLHGLYSDVEFGPRWNGAELRWLEDFGSADDRVAMDDLARRLAGWSQRSGVPIQRLRFGGPGDR